VSKLKAEYIWLDGHKPTSKLRSKTKIIDGPVKTVAGIPQWGFDGSSTEQASGDNSDCALKPVYYVPDPIRGGDHILVMSEVNNADGTPHVTNTRAPLRKVAEKYKDHEPWFGIEQEYTFFLGRNPLGWPEGGYPAPQGPFYCGVGADEVFGRDIVEDHMEACMEAGIMISGINFQIGSHNYIIPYFCVCLYITSCTQFRIISNFNIRRYIGVTFNSNIFSAFFN